MRLLMWGFTIILAFAGLGLWMEGGFIGAGVVALALCVLALLACPFLWSRPGGLVPDELAMRGRTRLMLALALIFAAPLLLPWRLWL